MGVGHDQDELMEITVSEMRRERLNEMIVEIGDALLSRGGEGSDVSMLLRDEGRRLTKAIINNTPPSYGAGQAARNKGEHAVRRDVKKIFTPVDEQFLDAIGSQFGLYNVDHWFTTADGKKQHIRWDRIDPSGAGMAAFHNNHRDKRGRARNPKTHGYKWDWYSAYVVSKENFYKYQNRILSHVGRRKAAWAVTFAKLGGKVQEWIGRHLNAGVKGECLDDLRNFEAPSITMISRAPGVGDDARIINDAMGQRIEAMGRRARLILSGYAKDVKEGIKIRKRGSEWPKEVSL